MKNKNVKVMEVNVEKMLDMKKKMVIRKNGDVVMMVGLDNLRRRIWERDWMEVERKGSVVKYRKMKLMCGVGKVMYCVMNENEREYGMKWLRSMVEKKYGMKNVSEEIEVNELGGEFVGFGIGAVA